MEKKKIERINYLAKKSKESGLTDAEKAEQTQLRNEYREGFKKNFNEIMANTRVIHDE